MKLLLSICICWFLLGLWSNPGSAQDLAGAQAALKAKDYDKVIATLTPFIEKLNREGLYTLAEAQSEKGNSVTAIKLYEAAQSLNPKDAATKRRIGLEQLKQKKEDLAMATLREAIEMNPDYEPAYVDLGDLLEKRSTAHSTKMNRYDVRLLYEDLIKRPNVGHKAPYITKLCELTSLDGQYDVAPGFCEEGIKLNPREPKNYVNLASDQKETGKTEEAEKTYAKAADSFAKSEIAQVSMAKFYEDNKNFMKAYNYYKRGVDANPDSLPALYGVSHAAVELQKFEEAFKALTHACELNRNANTEVRKALRSATMQKIQPWTTKLDQLTDHCGISKE